MNRVPIELETFHHIYNRGTEKRLIFMCDEDRTFFLKLLHILNDADIESPSKSLIGIEDAPHVNRHLTNICAFCLMPNHFHLLLYECTEGGISKFMQRLGTAYTMYFNEKYERSGALFQGTFKSRVIEDESYLQYVIDYLHLNPIQHKDKEGLKNSLQNSDLKILDTYKWSSYLDFCGEQLNSHLLQKEILDTYLKVPDDYRAWLLQQNDFEGLGTLAIDF